MKLFSEKILGLDISDRSIEMALGEKRNGRLSFAGVRVVLEAGIVSGGRVEKIAGLEAALDEALKKLGIEKGACPEAVFSLPEEITYLIAPEIGLAGPEEPASAVSAALSDSVPVGMGSLAYSYRLIAADKAGNRTKAVIAAVDRQDLEDWGRCLSAAGIRVRQFDFGVLAPRRVLDKAGRDFLFVDIGAAVTRFTIFENGSLAVSDAADIAGNYLDDRIAQAVTDQDGGRLTLARAEEIKKTCGLEEDGGYSNLRETLAAGAGAIYGKIQAARDHFKNKSGHDVPAVILGGGGAGLRGLAGLVKARAGENSWPAEVFLASDRSSFGEDALLYGEAIGAALGAWQGEWRETDPFIVAGRKAQDAGRSGRVSRIGDAKTWIRTMRRPLKMITLAAVIVVFLAGLLSSGKLFSAVPALFKNITNQDRAYQAVTTIDPDGGSSPEAISGRIIRQAVSRADSYSGAVAIGRMEAAKQLQAGEMMWREPLNPLSDRKSVAYPVVFEWLVFKRSDLIERSLAGAKGAQDSLGSLKSFTLDKLEDSLALIGGYDIHTTAIVSKQDK